MRNFRAYYNREAIRGPVHTLHPGIGLLAPHRGSRRAGLEYVHRHQLGHPHRSPSAPRNKLRKNPPRAFRGIDSLYGISVVQGLYSKAVGLQGGWASGTRLCGLRATDKRRLVRFGAPICFEDAYATCVANSRLGGDLLINLTDMSWSKTESAEVQQWASARFRAIEARKTLVRSTNGGVSCIVGPYGEVLDSMPLFVPASKFVHVPISAIPRLPYIYALAIGLPCRAVTFAALSIILIIRRGSHAGPRQGVEPFRRVRRRPKEVVA